MQLFHCKNTGKLNIFINYIWSTLSGPNFFESVQENCLFFFLFTKRKTYLFDLFEEENIMH